MAKAKKPTDNQGKIVPAAELVGDHAAKQSTALVVQPAITIDANGADPDAAAKMLAAMQAISDQTIQHAKTTEQLEFVAHIAEPNAQQLADFADDHGFPLLEQACETFMLQHGHSNIKAIRITANSDGLRRAGQHHAGTVDHPTDTFTGEQMEQLLAEPLLIVEFIAPEA